MGAALRLYAVFPLVYQVGLRGLERGLCGLLLTRADTADSEEDATGGRRYTGRTGEDGEDGRSGVPHPLPGEMIGVRIAAARGTAAEFMNQGVTVAVGVNAYARMPLCA